MNRLALGTAQFGLPYGIANRTGQVSPADAKAMLGLAAAAGVDTLDTAIAYGDSEARLGAAGVAGFKLVTKLPPVPVGCADVAGWARESVWASRDRLQIPGLYGLLLHRSRDFLGPHGDALYGELLATRERGETKKIGVSIYSPQELELLLPKFRFDLVQAPFNVIDRRLATSGWLGWLAKQDVEVHVRSIFMQGLLLMEGASRPALFDRWRPLWERWDGWLAGQPLSPLEACLGFALSYPEIDRVVVGADRRGQLEEIIRALDQPSVAPLPDLASDDPDLVDPTRWKTQ